MKRPTGSHRLGWMALASVLTFSLVASAQPSSRAAPGSAGKQPASPSAQSSEKPPAQAKASEEEPLPKPGPRGPDETAKLSLPPFMGFFGPAELLKKTGFRGTEGSWIEFQLHQSEAGGAVAGTMRIQQVGPPVRGGRWLEMILTEGAGKSAGVRMLTRGEDDDNMERIIVQAPGFPPMELPISSAQLDWIAPGAPGATDPSRVAEMGELKHVGREEVAVPLGRFIADRWDLTAGEVKLSFWTTTDPSVPFSGLVRVLRTDGDFVAVKAGTDATATVVVPARLY